jgi:NADH-quinone oxidoreductase subunit E
LSRESIDGAEIRAIVEAYPPEARYALAILQDLQRQYNFVPREAMESVAGHIGGSVAQLYAMATFYKALSLKPKGRHIVKVCDGTACHLHGALNLVEAVQRELGIGPGETTADGEFSLETVNCLGSCAIAPVLMVGETFHGQVTPEKLPRLLAQYQAGLAPDGEATT